MTVHKTVHKNPHALALVMTARRRRALAGYSFAAFGRRLR
jgi:hypothetical protein